VVRSETRRKNVLQVNPNIRPRPTRKRACVGGGEQTQTRPAAAEGERGVVGVDWG